MKNLHHRNAALNNRRESDVMIERDEIIKAVRENEKVVAWITADTLYVHVPGPAPDFPQVKVIGASPDRSRRILAATFEQTFWTQLIVDGLEGIAAVIPGPFPRRQKDEDVAVRLRKQREEKRVVQSPRS